MHSGYYEKNHSSKGVYEFQVILFQFMSFTFYFLCCFMHKIMKRKGKEKRLADLSFADLTQHKCAEGSKKNWEIAHMVVSMGYSLANSTISEANDFIKLNIFQWHFFESSFIHYLFG